MALCARMTRIYCFVKKSSMAPVLMTRIIRECRYWWKDLFFQCCQKLHGSGARMTRTIRGSPMERYRKIDMARHKDDV